MTGDVRRSMLLRIHSINMHDICSAYKACFFSIAPGLNATNKVVKTMSI